VFLEKLIYENYLNVIILMKKTLLIGLVFLLMIYSVEAITCSEETTVPCEVLTPFISCALYNYSVYDNTGSVVQDGIMTAAGGGIYNFTLDVPIANGYQILLCSGHTALITVIPIEAQDVGKGAILLGLLFSQFLLLLFFLYFNHVLGEETRIDGEGYHVQEHLVLRIFLLFVGFLWTFKIYNVLAVLIEGYLNVSQFITILGIQAYSWIFYVFVSIYLFLNIFYILRMIQTAKVRQLQY